MSGRSQVLETPARLLPAAGIKAGFSNSLAMPPSKRLGQVRGASIGAVFSNSLVRAGFSK